VKQALVRIRSWWVDLQDSLWLFPAVGVVGAIVLARLLVAAEPVPEWIPGPLVFVGGPEGARAVLAELTGATFTVVGVVFSLTVVALQMASSQFTPRLLRTFLKDRGVQLVLTGLVSTGVYYVSVLRHVRSVEGEEPFVPELAVTVGLLGALLAAGLLVYFLHHLTSQLRVDVIMSSIRAESLDQLAGLAAPRGKLPDVAAPDPPADAVVVTSRWTGYLQTVDVEALVQAADRAGLVMRLRPTAGTYVIEGTTLAWVWALAGGPPEPELDDLSGAIHQGIHLGPERTESGDLAFGLRQLEDIAGRALSTGVNDPTTAVQAVAQMSAVLVAMAGHPLGVDLGHDGEGNVRVAVPRAPFGEHLDLAIRQIRRYGADEPDVLLAILGLLTDVAEHVADDADRADAVRHQIARTRDVAVFDEPAERVRLERAVSVAYLTLDEGQRRPPPTEAA
jgi:uncharacterized membrane protein